MDPVRVGRAECDAWVAYYRRDWPKMLAGVLGMVRHGFALGPVRDLRAAWHVLRANQAWAPFPDNDPAAARLSMARFYQLTVDAGRLDIDPRVAADLEVEWWHRHRVAQHDPTMDQDALIGSLIALYAYIYRADLAAVRRCRRAPRPRHGDLRRLGGGWLPVGQPAAGRGTAGSGRVVHRASRRQRPRCPRAGLTTCPQLSTDSPRVVSLLDAPMVKVSE